MHLRWRCRQVTVPPIDVTAKGTVLLGSKVSCDGFSYGAPIRVQTHVHTDHLRDFSTSKGYQDIFMAHATRQLLCAEHGADLPYRSNVIGMDPYTSVSVHGVQLELYPSTHMLGAVQVKVTTPDGLRLGYSGDFKWPLERVIEVDALVVDSTYGSPDRQRQYTQPYVDARFTELVHRKYADGPVVIHAFRGTLERALFLLAGIPGPVLVSARAAREISVYRQNGLVVGDFILLGSEEGRLLQEERRYVRLVQRGEPVPDVGATVIHLSAQMNSPVDPIIEYSDRAYNVAMTDHADFGGTLEYVRATGAKYVVTDNTRGHGVELAQELQRQLGIEARPSAGQHSYEWGT